MSSSDQPSTLLPSTAWKTHAQEDVTEQSGPPAMNLRQQPRKRYDGKGEEAQKAPSKTPARKAPAQEAPAEEPKLSSTESDFTDVEEEEACAAESLSQYATPSEVHRGPLSPSMALASQIPMVTDHVVTPIHSEIHSLWGQGEPDSQTQKNLPSTPLLLPQFD